MRARTGGLLLLALALGVLASSRARAQEGEFDLGTFRPALGGAGPLLTVERPAVMPHGQMVFGTWFDYAQNPRFAAGGGTPVSERNELTLTFAVAMAERLELGLALPVLWQDGVTSPDGPPAASGFALGDLGLGVKLVLGRAGPFAWGLAGDVRVPTATRTGYVGSGSGRLRLLAGVEAGPFRLAGEVGYRRRDHAVELGATRQADELAYGAGAGVVLADAMEVIAELYGARGLVDDPAPVSPLEGLVGVRWHLAAFALTVAGGAGLVDGLGAPDVRLVAALAYRPRRPRPARAPVSGDAAPGDHDADGVDDRADRCPISAEDRDGFEDEDGCSDWDHDRDEVPDVLDGCVADAEDRDGVKDDDGCPDPDDDGDGVADVQDACDDSAEDLDGWRDGDGCDDPDNDHDGVLDVVDACALEPETINGVQDEDGCADAGEPDVVVKADRLELLRPIEFAGDGALLKASATRRLEQVAAWLRAYPEIARLRVVAHVPVRGSAERAEDLGRRRAAAVVKLLVDRGIEPTRLDVAGRATPGTDRVELLIVEKTGRVPVEAPR